MSFNKIEAGVELDNRKVFTGAVKIGRVVMPILIIASLYLIIIPSFLQSKYNKPEYMIFGDLEFSPDGRFLASATYENHVLWNMSNGNIIYKSPCECESGRTFFSPDSKYMADISKKSYNIFDIYRKKVVINRINEHSSFILEAFNPHGSYVSLGQERHNKYQLKKINLQTHKETELQLNLDSQILRRLNNYPLSEIFVRVLNKPVAGGWIVFLYTDFDEVDKNICAEGWMSDKNRELSISLYDLNKGNMVKVTDISGKGLCLENGNVFSGGDKIFIFNHKSVTIVDIKNKKFRNIEYDETSDTNMPHCVSYNGEWIAVLNFTAKEKYGRTVKIYSADSGEIVREIQITEPQPVKSIAVNYEKRMLAVGFGLVLGNISVKKSKFVVYDIDTGKEIGELKLSEN